MMFPIQQGKVTTQKLDMAIRSMYDLSKQKYTPAVFVVGLWKTTGEHANKNVPEGLVDIQNAADKNFAPALYELGVRHIEGRDLPADPEKGFDELRSAAILGNGQAQFYLAEHYEVGQGVPQDLERAQRYYRLCAAGVAPAANTDWESSWRGPLLGGSATTCKPSLCSGWRPNKACRRPKARPIVKWRT